jgi:hypothetical protein
MFREMLKNNPWSRFFPGACAPEDGTLPASGKGSMNLPKDGEEVFQMLARALG